MDTLNCADKIEFYKNLIENQQNFFNHTLTTIGIISGIVILLLSLWVFFGSKQQIILIAEKIIKKGLRRNEQLIMARTYLISSDLFYNNKQYDAAEALQLLSILLFLRCGDYKSAHIAMDPLNKRALVGLDIKKICEYLSYYGYDYRDLSDDIAKYDKKGLIEEKAYGTLKNMIEELKKRD